MALKKILFLSLIVLCGCSGKWHAKQSKKHELLAEAKGVKMTADTVYKDKIIKVFLPADSSSSSFTPALDTTGFKSDIEKNDSLVAEINRLKNDSLGISLNKEKTLSRLQQANRELSALRERMIAGYSKDSTYVLAHDSITSITIRIENGLLKSANYKRKETTVTTKERIPIEIKKVLEMGYTHWQLLAAVLVLFVLGFIVGRLTKSG